MYENIKSCVFSGNMKSKYSTSDTGVRQGENLSPLLFALYINDLETYLLSKGNNHIDFKDDAANNLVKLFTVSPLYLASVIFSVFMP